MGRGGKDEGEGEGEGEGVLAFALDYIELTSVLDMPDKSFQHHFSLQMPWWILVRIY